MSQDPTTEGRKDHGLSEQKEARYVEHMNGKPLPNRRERRRAARELARALNHTRKAQR